MTRYLLAFAFSALTAAQSQPATQPATAQPDTASGLVTQGRRLEDAGKFKEALAFYRQAAAKDPKLFDAHYAMGRVLDLEGQYAEARRHLGEALTLAPESGRPQVLSAMAISHAFEGNAAEAGKYYQQVFDAQIQSKNFEGAGGTANALGRVYLETGDEANAEKWYRTGYETAKKIENRSAADVDLWEMRWQHAQARIAARRGQFETAHKHVGAVRAIVDKGTLDESQRANYPYVAGYVAFYQGNHDRAIAELSKGNLDDPFVLGLLAQAYEKKKDQAKARELYEKILTLPGHSLQVALSRPLAQRHLSGR